MNTLSVDRTWLTAVVIQSTEGADGATIAALRTGDTVEATFTGYWGDGALDRTFSHRGAGRTLKARNVAVTTGWAQRTCNRSQFVTEASQCASLGRYSAALRTKMVYGAK